MYSDGFKSFWFVQIPAFGVKSTTMKRGRNIYNTVRNVIMINNSKRSLIISIHIYFCSLNP